MKSGHFQKKAPAFHYFRNFSRISNLLDVECVVVSDFGISSEDSCDECGADPHTVSHLSPVDSSRVVVAGCVDFGASWERVQDDGGDWESFEVVS